MLLMRVCRRGALSVGLLSVQLPLLQGATLHAGTGACLDSCCGAQCMR